ncbi:MAG: type II toxin-antitoxin system Y4mF family antitoxin [Candidatus Riflebacteria bacterium]
MERKTLGQLISEKRKKHKLTQRQLAEKAGVGLRFIRELEKDKATLQMNKVNQVLYLFGLELGAIDLDRERLLNEES